MTRDLTGLRSEWQGHPARLKSWPGPRWIGAGRPCHAAGFSLLELIVAMTVFLVVGAASFSLFSRHEALLSQTQGIAGLNIGLRNALSQLQMDVVNAGNGLVVGANVPAWPVGVTITNSNPTAAQCDPTNFTPPQYQAACFDQLTVVMVDPKTPPVHPLTSSGGGINTYCGASCTVTVYGSLSGTINPGTGVAYTPAQVYSNFQNGDQVLFVTANPTGTQYMYTTAKLTANGINCTSGCPVANTVQLTFNTTLGPSASYPSGGNNNAANDPISITTNAPSSELTSSFGTSDWLVRLMPIAYSVNVTNNNQDPQLIRTQLQGSSGSQVSVGNVVMDQVIGFKVGAALRNNLSEFAVNTLGTTVNMVTSGGVFPSSWVNQLITINNGTYTVQSVATGGASLLLTTDAGEQTNVTLNGPITQIYPYNYLTSGYNSDYALVQAVRVTIIGRTTPSTDPTYTYRNAFDGGAYQIRGSSIIVNPRNLTMRDY